MAVCQSRKSTNKLLEGIQMRILWELNVLIIFEKTISVCVLNFFSYSTRIWFSRWNGRCEKQDGDDENHEGVDETHVNIREQGWENIYWDQFVLPTDYN